MANTCACSNIFTRYASVASCRARSAAGANLLFSDHKVTMSRTRRWKGARRRRSAVDLWYRFMSRSARAPGFVGPFFCSCLIPVAFLFFPSRKSSNVIPVYVFIITCILEFLQLWHAHPKSRKSASKKKIEVNQPQKHIIHKALNEIAEKEGLTRARITQIMDLLKLQDEMIEFLFGLDDPKEIRKYSERRLRKSLAKR